MTHEGREGLCGAFPRKPFVDTAVITCRGGESGEEGGGSSKFNSTRYLFVRSGHLV